ncbi:ABC-2 family transporter protein [Candidatus Acetothermia bacterium]|nr:ABC-2 family transporter protein [Candidatus Acetothermia bacterium]
MLRKYWKTAALEATGYIGDDPMFFVQFVFRFLRVIVLLSVWRMILANQEINSGMSLAAVLTYTLIGEVFHEQLNPQTGLAWALLRGKIAYSMIQPIGLVEQFSSKMVGHWLFNFALFSIPLLLISPLLGVTPTPVSLTVAFLFMLSLLLCISVGVALDFIITALGMVYFEQTIYAIERVRTALTLLLSGAIIPLAFMPWNLGEVLAWLPFASTASAPLKIYTGTGDPWFTIGVQLGWSIILWPLSHWLWESNREKLVSFGG